MGPLPIIFEIIAIITVSFAIGAANLFEIIGTVAAFSPFVFPSVFKVDFGFFNKSDFVAVSKDLIEISSLDSQLACCNSQGELKTDLKNFK